MFGCWIYLIYLKDSVCIVKIKIKISKTNIFEMVNNLTNLYQIKKLKNDNEL